MQNNFEQNDPYLILIPSISDTVEFKLEGENQNVVVYIKQDKKLQKFFRKLKFKIPEYKTIKFDEYSSSVFKLIDGKTTIYEIGIKLQEQYGDGVEPLYERLVTFIEYLTVQSRWVTLDGLSLDKRENQKGRN